MTTLHDAQLAVTAEIEGRIEALTPAQQSRYRFVAYGAARQSAKPLAEYTGQPRVFRVSPILTLTTQSLGCNHHRAIGMHALEIVYPLGDEWAPRIAGDLEQIRHDLATSAPTSAGVSYRMIASLEGMTRQQVSEDPWQLVSVPLEIYYDVTQ